MQPLSSICWLSLLLNVCKGPADQRDWFSLDVPSFALSSPTLDENGHPISVEIIAYQNSGHYAWDKKIVIYNDNHLKFYYSTTKDRIIGWDGSQWIIAPKTFSRGLSSR